MAKVSGEQKGFSVLAYLGLLVLIPLLVKKDDDYIHFHTKQGLVLLIMWVIIGLIGWLPLVGRWLSEVLGFALAIVVLIAIVQVLMGKKWEIPVVCTYADKMNM